MKPGLTRCTWVPLLLCTALGSLACDSLKSEPTSSPKTDDTSGGQLLVTLSTEGPEFCREGQWTLSVHVEGNPDKVELVTQAEGDPEPSVSDLTPPYRHAVDCATHAQGLVTFAARAVLGEQSVTSRSATVVVDRTPPVVGLSRPDGSFPHVHEAPEIGISEPLLAGSLEVSPTVLRDDRGFSVAHQVVLSEDGKVLRLVPASPLRPPAILHVDLSQVKLKDRAGNQGVGVHSHRIRYWPFSRVGDLWHNPSHYLHSLATEQFPEGRPVLAFVTTESFGVVPQLGVNRWNGTAWEPLPAPREPHARAVAPELPRLATSRLGSALVLAWSETQDSTSWIHVVKHDGMSWVRLGAPLDTRDTHPRFQLALDWWGRPFLVYPDGAGGLRVMRWSDTAWEPLGDPRGAIPELQTYAGHPAITVEGGTVFVAWSGFPSREDDAQHVFVTRYANGRWHRMGRLLRGTEQGSTWDLAIKGEGEDDVVVAWRESAPDRATGMLFVSRWNGDLSLGDWGTPERIQAATELLYLGPPLLELDADGEPWVAWQRRGSGDAEGVYRRRRATGWEPEQFIAGEMLSGFRLDAKGLPWASAGYPGDLTIIRPQ
ncbi:hypothetical protein [Pyxidicoccus xibeiensis]|uniref:hypothetical protein n=1 Tax=Pyxidicoccus xibeiensis TaxID=2906759 RepID=UPI0020A6DE51|nr:hypothetical protein [Pyxidicoccus xibeiensis]MCP3142790.1 hypothetical protein [Pyxidicoccus xibeiensis]